MNMELLIIQVFQNFNFAHYRINVRHLTFAKIIINNIRFILLSATLTFGDVSCLSNHIQMTVMN